MVASALYPPGLWHEVQRDGVRRDHQRRAGARRQRKNRIFPLSGTINSASRNAKLEDRAAKYVCDGENGNDQRIAAGACRSCKPCRPIPFCRCTRFTSPPTSRSRACCASCIRSKSSAWCRAAWPTATIASAPSQAHARKRDRYDRVAEAAAPVLDRLCQKVSWPSDLFVPAGDHMERRETSRLQTPYFSHPSYLTRVGQPVNWLMTGVGRAYLAFCPTQERDAIIQLLRKSDQLGRSAGA